MTMNKMTILQESVIEELIAIVGKENLRLDKESLNIWGQDWSKHFTPNASAIVFPATTKEVQQIVRLANQNKIALIPSGGRTGLSAACVATQGELVVSLDRMNKVLNFYPFDKIVHIQAGMITQELQEYALDKGLYYPVDFASSGSSQIGGNIGTNAGGIKVIHYGLTRNWILGLTVITGKGDILHLNNGIIKNATGYPLQHLFIGSEGTLGIVTEVQVKLCRKPKDLKVMLFAVKSFEPIMKILQSFETTIDLTAFEFFNHLALQKVCRHTGLSSPFEDQHNFYVLIEFESTVESTIDNVLNIFEFCLEQGWIEDGVISESIEQAKSLWRFREDISETISEFTPYKNDISVMITHVPNFIADIEKIVLFHYPEFEICWFGHIGDGNLHLNILKPISMAKEDFFEKCKNVNLKVFEIVKKYQGSISAEHGVGLTKKAYLNYTKSETEIEYMKNIKKVFDPNNIMNPGKIFD